MRSVELLRRGEVDCFLSGPLRTFDLAGKGVDPILASIVVVNHRCPFYLVGLGAGPKQPLEALPGCRIIVRRAAPPIRLLLRHLVRLAGIDVESITWVNATEGQTELEALTQGAGDYALLAEPEVEAVISSSRGHIAMNLPQEFGPLHFASVVAPRAFVDAKRELATLIVGSVQQAKEWMCRASSDKVAEALGDFTNEIPREELVGAIARGQRDGLWGGGPAMSRWHYEILRDAYTGEDPRLESVPFSAGVDNRIADELELRKPA